MNFGFELQNMDKGQQFVKNSTQHYFCYKWEDENKVFDRKGHIIHPNIDVMKIDACPNLLLLFKLPSVQVETNRV